VTQVVALKPVSKIIPVRAGKMPTEIPLVMLFARNPDLLPFVRFLFREHRIFSIQDWDNASPRLFDAFNLAEPLRIAFLERVGRPAPPRRCRGEKRVIFLADHRRA